MSRTLGEMGEREALALLQATCASATGVSIGAGDDAAMLVVPPTLELLATTDAFVEGVHWDRAWMTPDQIGARLAAANLSDIAAMAGEPRWALVSYGLPPDTAWEWLELCQRGLQAALLDAGALVVGGNLTRTGGERWIDVTLLGVVSPVVVWRRRGARAGDVLAVTGAPGRAGAAARLVAARGTAARGYRALLAAWMEPAARVAEARAMARAGAVHAAIDISDGLGGDLATLCAASRVGALIEEALLPTGPELEAAARDLGAPLLELQLGPSDDYELLLAVDPERWSYLTTAAQQVGCPLQRIGKVVEVEAGITLRETAGGRSPVPVAGWDHFRRRG